jgi:hypothetical protein
MDQGQVLRAEAGRVWDNFRSTRGEPTTDEPIYDTLCHLAESLDSR